jgi:hypothetical protein
MHTNRITRHHQFGRQIMRSKNSISEMQQHATYSGALASDAHGNPSFAVGRVHALARDPSRGKVAAGGRRCPELATLQQRVALRLITIGADQRGVIQVVPRIQLLIVVRRRSQA